MEKWIEFKKGSIPLDTYTIYIQAGEENGLKILLKGQTHRVNLDFGAVQAFRTIDEGLVQTNLYSEVEIEKYRQQEFENVIYELSEGAFFTEITKISGGYSEFLELKHFVIVTRNYNLDILTLEDPRVTVIY